MREKVIVAALVVLSGCGGGSASHDAGGNGGGAGGTGGDAGGRVNVDAGSGGSPAGDAAADSGGSDAGTACPFTACGGDLVGNWTIDGLCLDQAPDYWAVVYQCSGADGTSQATFAGTWTFRADGTYSRVAAGDTVNHYSVALSCLTEPDCATYAGDRGVPTTCTGGTLCTCTDSSSMQVNDGGTYTVSGSSLTTIRSDGTSTTRQFCVGGNRLAILSGVSNTLGQLISAHR